MNNLGAVYEYAECFESTNGRQGKVLVDNTLTSIYTELDTIKWSGKDQGWNLAVKAVQDYLMETLIEHKGKA